jgi:hypothetical protein
MARGAEAADGENAICYAFGRRELGPKKKLCG